MSVAGENSEPSTVPTNPNTDATANAIDSVLPLYATYGYVSSKRVPLV
jgi:hypothetical protein